MQNMISMTSKCFVEFDMAATYESDMVKLVNPDFWLVDKFFVFELIPHCKTSHEGMKKVFGDLGQKLQLFSIDDNGKSTLLPTAKQRSIHFCCDALTCRNFQALKPNLVKKLTEIGSAPYAMATLESLLRITCVNDYFHEIRMHRQACIYLTMYGCFLQAIQFHLSYKGITGDP